MKTKIGNLINTSTKQNLKKLKKALKKEIRVLNYLGKYPPRYYAYKMMLKYINETIFWKDIFNNKVLEQEIEVEDES